MDWKRITPAAAAALALLAGAGAAGARAESGGPYLLAFDGVEMAGFVDRGSLKPGPSAASWTFDFVTHFVGGQRTLHRLSVVCGTGAITVVSSELRDAKGQVTASETTPRAPGEGGETDVLTAGAEVVCAGGTPDVLDFYPDAARLNRAMNWPVGQARPTAKAPKFRRVDRTAGWFAFDVEDAKGKPNVKSVKVVDLYRTSNDEAHLRVNFYEVDCKARTDSILGATAHGLDGRPHGHYFEPQLDMPIGDDPSSHDYALWNGVCQNRWEMSEGYDDQEALFADARIALAKLP